MDIVKKTLCILGAMIASNSLYAEIKIQPIEPNQIDEVRNIIIDAAFELQIMPAQSRNELKTIIEETGELDDLNHIEEIYQNNNGIFLTMVKDDEVIGSGALKKIDAEVAELKRIFFKSEYRGLGLGSKMVSELIAHAIRLGYKKLRLDVYNPVTQIAAVALYKKFGFYEIAPYKKSTHQFFMEKVL